MAKVPGKNGTVTVIGATAHATNIRWGRELGEVDVTSLTSSGAHENIGDITRTTFSFDAYVESGAAPNWAPGQNGTITLAVTGGRTITGTGTIYNADHAVGPRGAYTISVRGAYTGTVTES